MGRIRQRVDKLLQVYNTNSGNGAGINGAGLFNRCELRLAAAPYGKSHITAGIAIGLFSQRKPAAAAPEFQCRRDC